MTSAPPPVAGPDDPNLAAAEYVLGTLLPEQVRAFEALVLSDSAAAASLQAWEARLSPLADAVPPVAPPPELWRRLALAAGINDAPPHQALASRVARLWGDLRLWRGLTLGAGVAAAALALALLRPPPGPELLAALSQVGTPGATFLVRIGADGAATIMADAPPAPVLGQSLELWALAPGAAVPVSLGVLPGAGTARLHAPARPGTQLMLSSEPAGGSRTGAPTGPVVYSGVILAGE